jgi:signal transduction histidine kinase
MDESRRSLEEFLGAHPDLVTDLFHGSERQVAVLLDDAGTVLYANGVFRDLIGENRSPVGRPLSRYLENEEADALPGVAPGERRQAAIPLRSADGSVYRFEATVARGERSVLLVGQRAVLTHSDAIQRMSLINEEMVNLSRELTRKSAALKRSNQELEDFASVASHDLRAPLRRIEALGELLRTEAGEALNEQAREYLRLIRNAAAQMRQMVSGLLEVSRVNTRNLQTEAVDLTRLAREVADELVGASGEREARIRIDPIPPVQADAAQMRQLMQNLLANAVKFRKPGAPADIRVHEEPDPSRNRPGRMVRFAVVDRGIGFDPDFAERIFGMFERLEGPREVEGTGIGLSVCKRIVERHGGTIGASGQAGEGARFTVALPRDEESAKETGGG